MLATGVPIATVVGYTIPLSGTGRLTGDRTLHVMHDMTVSQRRRWRRSIATALNAPVDYASAPRVCTYTLDGGILCATSRARVDASTVVLGRRV